MKIIADNVRRMRVNVFGARDAASRFDYAYITRIVADFEMDVHTKAYFRFRIFSFRVISRKEIREIAIGLILFSEKSCNLPF